MANSPAGPTGSRNPDFSPSYQDIDSDIEFGLAGDVEVASDDSQYETLLAEAELAFSAEEVEEIHEFLRERGLIMWMREYIVRRNIPLTKLFAAFDMVVDPKHAKNEEHLIALLKARLTRFLRRRAKLPQYNTVAQVIELLRTSKRIVVLTGAGISVSCGVPDFRSANGLYAMLSKEGYELDDPQQMFDIDYFRENPQVFFSFASRIYPTNFVPSPSHRFVKLLEDKGKLLRNYTQNIDTIESLCGVKQVLQCHGSFATASCMDCRQQVPGTVIKDDILAKRIPLCASCIKPKTAPKKKKKKKAGKKEKGWGADDPESEEVPRKGVMKPDITFFGEKLTNEFDRCLFEDREHADLLLVIGTSLKVAPVSEILAHLPHSVPQILINKTPIHHVNPDIVLLGDSDIVVEYLCSQLDWELPPAANNPQPNTKKRPSSHMLERKEPQRLGDGHIWLFEGAEPGNLIDPAQTGARSGSAESEPEAKRPKLEI